uniref:Uncharacterized protein n=2 Tax=Oryza glumipatula TaxID=40148 RepID=A0A0D9ZHX6_9ORYZ
MHWSTITENNCCQGRRLAVISDYGIAAVLSSQLTQMIVGSSPSASSYCMSLTLPPTASQPGSPIKIVNMHNISGEARAKWRGVRDFATSISIYITSSYIFDRTVD